MLAKENSSYRRAEDTVAELFAYGASRKEAMDTMIGEFGLTPQQADRIVSSVYGPENMAEAVDAMSVLDRTVFQEIVKHLSLKEYYKHENGKWNVYSKKGKKLGSHTSKKDALAQLQAIHLNREGTFSENNKIPGGLADYMTIADLVKRHGVSKEEIQSQLEKGIRAELEHTSDKSIAREIAMDHIYEDPNYYDKLATIEDKGSHTVDEGEYSISDMPSYTNPKYLPNKKRGGLSQEELEQILLKIIADIEDSDAMQEIQKSVDDVTEANLDDQYEIMDRKQLMEYVHRCIKEWRVKRKR